jgi:hypothetical protein
MPAIIDFLREMGAKDWVAVYAAVISTITGVVQIRKTWRDRPRLRVEAWYEAENGRKVNRGPFFCVRVANVGDRDVPIFPPRIEITQQNDAVSRILSISPADVAGDRRWEPLDDYAPEPFDLKATAAEAYRFAVDTSRVLAVRIVDRAGVVRFRRRTFLAPWYRCAFWVRHTHRAMMRKKPKSKVSRKPAA